MAKTAPAWKHGEVSASIRLSIKQALIDCGFAEGRSTDVSARFASFPGDRDDEVDGIVQRVGHRRPEHRVVDERLQRLRRHLRFEVHVDPDGPEAGLTDARAPVPQSTDGSTSPSVCTSSLRSGMPLATAVA